ncbi:DJ-1/PfpI family protein-like protein [Ampelomyces quisqualis]|uniref:DJ-1/PfpI family protein-like protein n=1 Tax=Ampelomyces quisqualis TaxID=50730 RepID=A0A6A5QXS9_AMPQU|nr:DJ-1/PfpI family protein-like protein [Ampelomyces quisqualis]
MPPTSPPTKIGVVLFPGFQPLDLFGPLDAFHILSRLYPLHLSILSSTLDPVPTRNWAQASTGSQFSASIVPTHTFATAPGDLDVLLIPGGLGATGPEGEGNVQACVEWLRELTLDGGKDGGIQWVLTVCTGSDILARAGKLEGRTATTNKRVFNDVKARHPNVNWVAKARWVVDGNIWTSSGISAGMDLAFAWIAEVWGEEAAQLAADTSEYERNTDAGDDRYTERWGAV